MRFHQKSLTILGHFFGLGGAHRWSTWTVWVLQSWVSRCKLAKHHNPARVLQVLSGRSVPMRGMSGSQ